MPEKPDDVMYYFSIVTKSLSRSYFGVDIDTVSIVVYINERRFFLNTVMTFHFSSLQTQSKEQHIHKYL